MTPNKLNQRPLRLDDIQDRPISDQDAPDNETKREAADLDEQEKAAYIRGLQQDIDERKTYANRIYWMLSLWLIGMFLLLMIQGFCAPRKLFYLDNSVLIAAIGGTTVNVIGIFIVVTRYLFPQHRK